MSFKITHARRIMRKAFEKDPNFKNAYVANIAMRVLYDQYDVPVDTANEQAEKILDLIFEKQDKKGKGKCLTQQKEIGRIR